MLQAEGKKELVDDVYFHWIGVIVLMLNGKMHIVIYILAFYLYSLLESA